MRALVIVSLVSAAGCGTYVDGGGGAATTGGDLRPCFGCTVPTGLVGPVTESLLRGIDRGAMGDSVAVVGDMDGDGLDEIAIGDRSNHVGGSNAGAVYLIYGRADRLAAEVFMQDVDATLIGDGAQPMAGVVVAAAGDIDGDGLADLLVGGADDVTDASPGGRIFVVYGSTTRAAGVVSLFDVAPQLVDGDRHIGGSVRGAGDVNGDGLDDFVVGAPVAYASSYPSATYLVAGSAERWSGEVVLASIALTTLGDARPDHVIGWGGGGVGDLDGDGFADVLAGSWPKTGGPLTVSLFYGGEVWPSARDVSSADAFAVITGNGGWNALGRKGDVTGDGTDDLILPDDGFPGGIAHVRVYPGGSRLLGALDPAAAMSTLDGESSGDRAGSALALADIDGDGAADVLIGAPNSNVNGFQTGSAFLIYGRAMPAQMSLADAPRIWRGETHGGGLGGREVPGGFDDKLGADVAAGDLDGDGYADALLGAPADAIGDPDGGRVRIIYGIPRE